MNSISEFCRRMQESLNKRTRAKTEAERIEAIQEMTELIRQNFKGELPKDWKLDQAGRDE